MDDNATDLGNMLNDSAPNVPEVIDAPEVTDQGEQHQVEPPAAKQEPDLVPRAALMDERRKRQELEQWVQQNKPVEAKPTADQFESQDAYLEALAERKADERFNAWQQKQQAEQQQAQVAKQTTDDLAGLHSAGAAKYADFANLVNNPDLPMTETMVNAMLVVDSGHEIAYHLAKNPADALRIASMAPTAQAREMGQLAKRLAAPPPESKYPSTLTNTRSTDGRFTNAQAYDGPSPLNEILGKRS